eukprot:CAMPEP_0118951410 /NCGR_PEP_ID=MMETSP1169-20130426/53057_1 /TAXON_ID=36882 /ORGANISM="Pyramimonas obovata, Strain CCMP722" /LENGTH=295 /DNA_ID=CAMNT_0006898459 /DNA_START=380 /DNA_END=1267 /DNA_ORIENTATION=+
MNKNVEHDGPFVYCDVKDYESLARLVLEHRVDHIVHLASLLSAVGEKDPQLTLKVNNSGTQNVLELARMHGLKVFAPSTIAVFGPSTPKVDTPDACAMQPTTMYGITKVHQELLGNYYHTKYGVDYRSIRYPGIVSSKAMPGGGTTDYAVDIYHEALKTGAYRCFLQEDAVLPMMYMPDCLKATADLMFAPQDVLTQTTYNVTAMSFSPAELSGSIRKVIPGFETEYCPDYRQEIASSWPRSIDDSLARRDWGWQNDFDIDGMTADMLRELAPRYGHQDPSVSIAEVEPAQSVAM